MSITSSPNMSLPIPGVGSEAGPAYANDINASLTLIDQHDHTPGKGAQLTTSSLNINTDLPFNGFSATQVKSVAFSSQSGAVSTNGSIYELANELYFLDGAGNNVQITSNGGVAGTPGSITNLTSPASATYVSGSSTFVWQSNSAIAANMDMGAAILRNLSPNSTFGITLQPPAGLAANSTITLPLQPAATSFVTMTSTGTLSPTVPISNGITLSMLATALQQFLVPTGAIQAFGGTSVPAGWLICDGTSVLRATYPDLFTAISTAYGSADGTHFNVPDLRGQFLRGVSGASTNDPDKTSRTAMAAGGNSGNNIGSVQANQVVSHTHRVWGATNNNAATGLGNAATSTMIGGNGATGSIGYVNNAPTGGNQFLESVGGSESRPINAYVNFIIKT